MEVDSLENVKEFKMFNVHGEVDQEHLHLLVRRYQEMPSAVYVSRDSFTTC